MAVLKVVMSADVWVGRSVV
jgi:hypothetical protein